MRATINNSILKGTVMVPPSKSLSHRMLIASALASNSVKVSNLLFSNDINATIAGLSKLGNSFVKNENSVIVKKSKITGGEIDCGESGSTVRFLIPIALTKLDDVTFVGHNHLVNRPLDTYLEIFDEQGLTYIKKENYLPLHIKGHLKSGVFNVRGDISSQFITGLLFALPLLDGDSRINITTELESIGYIDLTLDTLAEFGINIINNNYKEFIIKGNQEYKAVDTTVEGDFSQAAFWLVAGSLNGNIRLKGMNMQSRQGDKAIIDILKKMKALIDFKEDYIECLKSNTEGTVIDLSQCPDLGPVITVLASLSKGRTEIINASRLRIKECDRIKAMTSELNKLGANIKETEDGMIIDGVDKLHGGEVDSWNDHRIAMALAIASIKCEGEMIITNASAINKSYPHFFETFKSLGGDVIYE